jgi:hypothetical protein
MPMNPRLLRPLASGFDPRRISGLGGWWDATDSSTITTDTGVLEWRDKSSFGQKFSQTTGGSQPTVQSSGINGRQSIQFNGTNQWFDLGSQTIGGNDLGVGASDPFTLFLILRYAGNINGNIFNKAGITAAARTLQIESRIDNLFAVRSRGTREFGGVNEYPANQTLSITVQWSGTAFGFRTSARSLTTFVSVTPGNAAVESINISLGALNPSSPTGFFEGQIGEVLFYNKVLSSSEYAALSKYTQSKWGVPVP